ncbi:hypothetical protein L4D76_04150 [Photobacterium sagamiensis]|uniref:hypothetical protein n=1 Tax=Photobacterium sagamiensis TaxID=2910241 RepID=UPI003D0E8450
MTNNVQSKEDTIQAQIETLLQLLPTLKAELRFAGCEENAPILERIEDIRNKLKSVQ